MNKKEEKFVEVVWEYYKCHGRQSLPWRKFPKSLPTGIQAYRILVSEIMLQQTQVERVLPKYQSFIKRFPTIKHLACASLGDVLREWQGLGYNRRAKMLHTCAQTVVLSGKKFPRTYETLIALPGVGHYTAGAVLAFAFNTPISIIETNIRSVYLHYFFNTKENIHDSEIATLVERTLDRENPREWYYALMDYGVYIKKEFGNPNTKSKHHTRQSTFKGSDREIRGAILRLLADTKMTQDKLIENLKFEGKRILEQLRKLTVEGLVVQKRGKYQLP